MQLFFFDVLLTKDLLKPLTLEGGLRERVEQARSAYLLSNKREDAIVFSRAVFAWGRGLRVYGKLNLKTWNKHVHEWLRRVPDLSDKEAIERGVTPGVGVSFASKHLRLLYPERFATLDSVIDARLGYSRNIPGYMRFLSDLKSFKQEHRLQCSIGDLEEAIFRAIKKERTG